MLYGNGRVLCISCQLASRLGTAAEVLEDLQVARAGMDHACVRASHELVDEIEDFVEGPNAGVARAVRHLLERSSGIPWRSAHAN